MSVLFDSTTDRCKYDSTSPAAPPTGDYTIMVWFLSTNFAARYQTPAMMGSQTTGAAVYIQPSPTTSKTEIFANNGAAGVGATVLSTNTWYHMALVGNTGTAQATSFYLNGVLDASGTSGATAFSAQRIEYGNSTSAESVTGELAIGKVWNAKLTAAEILQEMQVQIPVRTANLWQWCPMLNHLDLVDYSGNARPLTGANLATGQGPPVPWAAIGKKARPVTVTAAFQAAWARGANRLIGGGVWSGG